MNRYRIKLKNGRVIGPLLAAQFQELFDKGHIDGSEECQSFPSGDWMPLSAHKDILLENPGGENATFLKKLDKLKMPEKKEALVTKVDDELDASFPKEFEFARETVNTKTNILLEEISSAEEEEEEGIEKTVVKAMPSLATPSNSNVEDNEDRTMVNSDAAKFFKEEKVKEEHRKKVEEENKLFEQKKKEEEERKANIDYENDSTQMVSLEILQEETRDEAQNSETELEQEKDALNLSQNKDLAFERKNLEKELKKREVKEPSDNKKKKLYIILVLVLAYVFFGGDEKKKKSSLEPIAPQIKFPVAYENPNKDKSQQLYEEGLAIYSTGNSYIIKLRAQRKFLAALEDDFDNNAAMAMYILSSSEVIKHSRDMNKASSKIYKLVEISNTKFLDNINLATGIASFYYRVGKPNASIDVIEKYISITQPSLKLFGIYLGSLIDAGDFSKASDVYNKISTIPNRPIEVYIETLRMDFLNDNYAKIAINLQEALDKFPESIELLLLKAKYDTYKEDLNSLKETLVVIKALSAGSSSLYISQYYEYLGLYYVLTGKSDNAALSFQKALKLNDSSQLRAKLAQIEEGTVSKDSQAFSLILESKAVDFINKAKIALIKEDLDTALNYAINAVDISNNYIPAQVLLADIQIKKGFFDIAIKSLEKVVKNNPLEASSSFALLSAYSESYKFNNARNLLSVISNSELKNDPSYSKSIGRYFYKANDYLQSISWFSKAVDSQPLDQMNYFYLGNIFFLRKNFKKAKSMVKRAIELDPKDPEFRVLFSNILYEMDSVDTALGYLRDIATSFPDSPEIQGQIAIYYFKSGQLTRFEEQKTKMETSPRKTENLYAFLIKASVIDEKFDDVIKYGNKLLAINPGNLKIRMLLGKILFEKLKFKESLTEFSEVKTRLPTYPKLLYYISRIYLLTGQVDKAIEMAKKELLANPDIEDTYVLLGDIHREKEKYIEAEKYYKEAQKKNSESPDALLGLAFISSKKNQFEVALDLYKKASSLDAENTEIHKYLGDTYRNLGQGKLAIESYKVYLELTPESKFKGEIDKYMRLLR